MSGPIVRKYGFPNFEKIFGAKEVPHGKDEAPAAVPPPGEPRMAEPARADDSTSDRAPTDTTDRATRSS
jgi:hypothetical protein